MDAGTVHTVIADGIGTVTFSHPRGNSLPGQLLRALAGAIDQLAASAAVRVLVLESGGEKTFCAGASFDELLSVKNLEQSRTFFSGFALVILAMRRCPKFIIARVQGKAVGGGVGLIAAADYVLASDAAAVRLSELALGIGPFVIGPAVERKIGAAAFGEMAIDADWRSAEWARARGLFAQTYPSVVALDEAVRQLATRLAAFHPEAMRQLKAVLWEGTEQWEQLLAERYQITASLALTEFVQGAIAAANRKA